MTNTGTLFTRTIKRFTHAPYNHSSLSFDQHLSEVYSFGRKKPYNPLLAGFIREDVYNGTFSYFPKTTCSYYRIEVTKEQLIKIRDEINFFKTNKNNYKYNLLGLFGIPLNIHINRSYAYFCSEFVADILSKCSIHSFKKPSSLVTPDDFRQCDKFELLYEGPLYEYPLLEKQSLSFNSFYPKRKNFPLFSKKEYIHNFKKNL